MRQLIDRLAAGERLTLEEWITLIDSRTPELAEEVFAKAREVRHRTYGHDVFIRGLIEFTNYCRNDCYYCGIRKSNGNAHRYRLTEDEILSCCASGYLAGFRTFVLQGGEDGYFTDERICRIVRSIKEKYTDCALTLSVGERSRESYEALYAAGADRYLLRHETHNSEHYSRLHPKELTATDRLNCLRDLKDIGFQVGAGFMVGSPYQTTRNLAEDLVFLQDFRPDMIGIGPFLPHHDTPFAGFPAGTMELTLYLLGLIRLMLPEVLLPATTALGSIVPDGRERGILAGANVIMPNLSPEQVRKDYLLYDNKLMTGAEAAECLQELSERLEAIGYHIADGRGDSLMRQEADSFAHYTSKQNI